MNRNVHGIVEQGILDLFYKKSLTADLGQRDIQDLVSRGLDLFDMNIKIRMLPDETFLYPVRLPQGQLTGPGADSDSIVGQFVSVWFRALGFGVRG